MNPADAWTYGREDGLYPFLRSRTLTPRFHPAYWAGRAYGGLQRRRRALRAPLLPKGGPQPPPGGRGRGVG